MTTSRDWIGAARPRTLPAAIVPVAVGVGVAHATASVVWWRAVLALAVSLAMQIGTNYANDYSDGVRGTDERRVGPTRLVAQGLATPGAVRNMAITVFAIGAVLGLVLAFATSFWILVVGAASIGAGWLYTGGPKPYGYAGYGELFVFVFFGLVAVVGTVYVSSSHVPGLAFLAAVPVGLCAVALLVVNNLRDIDTDKQSAKRTLAVALGAVRTRALYTACLGGVIVSVLIIGMIRPWACLALIALPLGVVPLRAVLRGDRGRDLIVVLGKTALFQLVLGALLAVGIAL